MISHLAPDRLVLAPDTLGNGHSDKPPVDRAEIGYYSGVLSEALDGLGIEKVDVWGSHTGALIAMEFAVRYPGRVRRLGMDGSPCSIRPSSRRPWRTTSLPSTPICTACTCSGPG